MIATKACLNIIQRYALYSSAQQAYTDIWAKIMGQKVRKLLLGQLLSTWLSWRCTVKEWNWCRAYLFMVALRLMLLDLWISMLIHSYIWSNNVGLGHSCRFGQWTDWSGREVCTLQMVRDGIGWFRESCLLAPVVHLHTVCTSCMWVSVCMRVCVWEQVWNIDGKLNRS